MTINDPFPSPMNVDWYHTLDGLQQKLVVNNLALEELREHSEKNKQQIQSSGEIIHTLDKHISQTIQMMGEIQQTQTDLSRLFLQQQGQFQEFQSVTNQLIDRLESNQVKTNQGLDSMKHQIIMLQQQLLALHQQIALLLHHSP